MNDKKIKEMLDKLKENVERNNLQAQFAYMDRITAQAILSHFLTEYFETPIVAQVRVECPTASLYLTQGEIVDDNGVYRNKGRVFGLPNRSGILDKRKRRKVYRL